MILMPLTKLSEANILAEGLQETLETHIFRTEEGYDLRVTISAGVVGYSGQKVHDAVELLRVCDQCLYQAKGSGRNRLISHEL